MANAPETEGEKGSADFETCCKNLARDDECQFGERNRGCFFQLPRRIAILLSGNPFGIGIVTIYCC